ncbi:phosphatase PAP2 family protein [Flavobacterium hercynium]|uniref:Phosphoesterase n=1 Tax=Flavobacterium hercynium TaxID=387094 RepID=A0A226H6T2_9FLAO|nr:phosphatase PAP2 family protein [Flavobacterium hercynium]OXA90019.1 phosphoesterase [Flavobacterium hercynium]SMP14417.1 PAP2 superfamily protein [Flavobacterium hercynium]
MNSFITCNCSKIKLSVVCLPLLLIISIVLFLYVQDALCAESYIQIQKDYFFFINAKLSQYPSTQNNLTQFGNALIILSFLSIFVVYAPKIWEYLASSLLISLIFCCLLKKTFAVPRPAAVYDHSSFSIIGETLTGHNSTPSGHSLTVFAVISVLLFAFMPKKRINQIFWSAFILMIGLLIVFTRVGVGAHHPLDVVLGSAIGFIIGVIGILINQKYNIWIWINNKKYYPFFMLAFLMSGFALIMKIINENLIIFYISLIILIVSLYKITTVYVKK